MDSINDALAGPANRADAGRLLRRGRVRDACAADRGRRRRPDRLAAAAGAGRATHRGGRAAPYGRGGETLVDTAVRRTWQIGADRVRIAGKHWPAMLASVVERAAAGLGVGAGWCAELYKLLVYDEGSFFVDHRDTEKSPGMFATLIVALPSLHTGGELVIRHRGREATGSALHRCLGGSPGPPSTPTACTRCCPSPRGAGSCWSTTCCARARAACPPAVIRAGDGRAGAAVARWCEPSGVAGQDRPIKLVYPLEHAYTPAELSFAALKGADAAAAGVLAAAARDAACDLHAALLRIEESGAAEYSGYSRSRVPALSR